MIKITNLNELSNYFDIPAEALDFLLSINTETENKRYDFSEDCYINVQSVETKPETPLMEAHVKFVDIQCLIDGEEKIFYVKKEGLPTECPYSADELFAVATADKKRSGDSISVVLPYGIGDCRLYKMPVSELRTFIAKGLEK